MLSAITPGIKHTNMCTEKARMKLLEGIVEVCFDQQLYYTTHGYYLPIKP